MLFNVINGGPIRAITPIDTSNDSGMSYMNDVIIRNDRLLNFEVLLLN